MHKGFTRKTLGVVGAALLSGSVFAAGPTLSNLPTVIITDKNTPGSFTNDCFFDNGGGESATTENRYRFTNAVDLQAYVNPGDSTLGEVNYMFEEFNSDSSGAEGSQRTGTSRAIYINTNAAYDAGGTIDRATVLGNSIGDVQNDNLLTLVDQVRSGGDGSVPGPDPGGAFSDYALLKLYVASTNVGTVSAPVSMKTMRVITTNDDPDCLGDQVSTSTSIFVPEACVDDFIGWFTQGTQQFPDISEDLTPTSTTFAAIWRADQAPVWTPTPTGSATGAFGAVAVTQAADNPTALGVFTQATPGRTTSTSTDTGVAPQFAVWASWRRDIESAPKTTVTVTAGRVYLIRWMMSVQAATQSATSSTVPDVRFRVGEATTFGIGQGHDVLPRQGANGIVGAGVQEHRSYYYAPDNAASGQEIGFVFDSFDLFNGSGVAPYSTVEGNSNYGLNLEKIEVYSFSRGDLSGESVILNHGGASFTIADGSTPPSSPTAFSQFTGLGTGDWQHRATTFVNDFAGPSDRNSTGAFAADVLSMSLVAGKENTIAGWDTLGAVFNAAGTLTPDHTAREITGNIGNDKLLFLDAWLSSPQGSTANNHLPVMRVGFQTDVYGESGFTQASPVRQVTQGRTAYIEFKAWNRTDAEDVGVLIAPTNALETGAKRYTAVMEPLIKGSATTISVRPNIQYYSFPLVLTSLPAYQDDTLDTGTIRIHRVAITTYDLPALPDPCAP